MKKFYNFLLVIIILLTNVFENLYGTSQNFVQLIEGRGQPDASIKDTFVDVVSKTGYAVEERFVITEDGYILSLHRIYAGPKSAFRQKKPLVLLLHGLLASTNVWVLRGPGKDFAYLLVDQGYDVWALNFRGNAYSRRNIRLEPTSPEFWRFSWHENGIYDLASAIDYMLAQTGLKKVTLVGHSMGATASYVLLSLRPEYNDKVDLVVSLAPVGIFTHQYRGNTLKFALRFGTTILNLLRRNSIHQVFGLDESIPRLLSVICALNEAKKICREIFFLFTGNADREQFDETLLPPFLQHYPAGTSLDTIEHYLQNLMNENFQEFDFGTALNFARYRSSTPPEYPLERITAPVLIYYGPNDDYVQSADAKKLSARLPNVVAAKAVPYKSFNHIDFVISKDSRTLLYDEVLYIIRKYKNIERLKYR